MGSGLECLCHLLRQFLGLVGLAQETVDFLAGEAFCRALLAVTAHEDHRDSRAGPSDLAERLLTKAKRLGEVAYTPQADLKPADRARRVAAQKQVGRFLRRFGVKDTGDGAETVDLVEKVFIDLAKRFADRPGGYTRIIKIGNRRGDNAPMSLIEFVGSEGSAEAPAATEEAAAS